MIPSRPLDLGGIITETIRIIKNIFVRSAVISLLCLLPGLVISILSLSELSSELEAYTKSYSQYEPETERLLRDAIALSTAKQPGLLYYQIQYPEIFTVLDSVSDAISENNRDSAQSAIWAELSSIQSTIQAKGEVHDSTYFWEAVLPSIMLAIVGMLLFMFGTILQKAMLTDLSCREFEHRTLSLAAIFKNAISRTVWLIFVAYFLIGLSMLIGMSLVVGITAAISPVFTVLGVLLSLGFIFYSLFRIEFCIAALVIENLGPIEAIKRSLELTAGRYWRVVGITIIVVLMIFTVSSFLSVPTSMICTSKVNGIIPYLQTGINVLAMFDALMVSVLILIFGSILNVLLTGSFTPAFFTTFYYDLRTRLEGPLEYENISAEVINPPETLTA